MYLDRHLTIPLLRAVQHRAPVLVQGPRGSGKTTLLRRELPAYVYAALDDAADRAKARRDPEGFIARLRGAAVIDDVQRAPELVRYLAEDRPQLPLVIASSVRLPLEMRDFELYGPTHAERQRRPALPLEMLGRFVPAVRGERGEVPTWPLIHRFLDQDVRGLVDVHDLDQFQEFLRLARTRSGELLRQQDLARETGVAHRTVVRWLKVLEDCFLTLRVPPFNQDFGRRIVRRSKLHFLEESGRFESEAVSEIYRNACHEGFRPRLRYWRDSNGLEISLVIESDMSAPAVPIVIAAAPNPAHDARLRRWMELAGVSQAAIITETGRHGHLGRWKGRVLRYTLAQL
jgi:hypothetical protein